MGTSGLDAAASGSAVRSGRSAMTVLFGRPALGEPIRSGTIEYMADRLGVQRVTQSALALVLLWAESLGVV